jgi:predicted dehydrogenase
MKSGKYGVLVHGAGWVSGQHVAAFSRNPHTEVVAISSRKLASARARADEAGLTDVGIYDDYETALKHDGVDIVSICTPAHSLRERPGRRSCRETYGYREAGGQFAR